MILGQEKLFFQQIEAASNRFASAFKHYQFKQGQLQGGSALQMDSNKRVTDWLIRGSRLRAEPVTSLDEFVQERMLGGNDLLGVQFFQLGMARASAVGRVVIRSTAGTTRGYGTGFLVAPGLMLTNNHVLPSAGAASPSIIQLNYQIDSAGNQAVPANFQLRPDAFFFTNQELDFSLCSVSARGENQEALADYGFLRVIEESGKIVEGSPVNIIQHPSGLLKQIAIRANQLIHVLDEFLHYETDTAPGSSGSPVFSDQWELVGLHHAGVPRKNAAGAVLAKDGSIWSSEQGDEQIDWIANEGIRASIIAKAIKAVTGLSADQKRLRDSVFEADFDAGRNIGPAVSKQTSTPAFSPDGTITWSFPIEFSIRVPGLVLPQMTPAGIAPGAPPVLPLAPPPGAVPSPALAARSNDLAEQRTLVDAAFAEAAAKKKYFDKAADSAASKAYYSGIGASLSAKKRYDALHKLLKDTHKTHLPYKPAIHLYPWWDLQPGASPSKVRSIYSGLMFPAKDFADEDLRTEAIRLEMAERLIREGAFQEDAVFESGVLEATAPFNCEHVVPQSWFQKRSPMRGDLHHLFACESDCNSFRGNTPYFDFPDFEEVIRMKCGRRDEDRFEPGAGKGEVARATLYFLLRYPGEIASGRFNEARVPILTAWHKANAVTDHEHHRNAAIFEVQGNRNPLIDHPEWIDSTDFVLGLTSAPSEEVLEAPERGFTLTAL